MHSYAYIHKCMYIHSADCSLNVTVNVFSMYMDSYAYIHACTAMHTYISVCIMHTHSSPVVSALNTHA